MIHATRRHGDGMTHTPWRAAAGPGDAVSWSDVVAADQNDQISMGLSHTPPVDPTLGAAGLAFVTAVVTTLWNTGGRAALERRAIQQELQIAAGMADGLARRQLEVATEGRVAMYVFRRVGPGRSAGFHFKMLAVVVIVYGLVGGLGQLVDLGPNWVEFITQVAFLSAVVLLGLVAALWVSEAWRDHMADVRRSETSAALQRLRQLDEVHANPKSDP